MPDFKAHVERQLGQLALDASLIEELAQDLEQRYEALIREGSGAVAAWREANEQMAWPRLSREPLRNIAQNGASAE
jgi:hypothetical protein